MQAHPTRSEPAAACAFNICAAMERGRGIGFENTLPWPKLIKDYNHYIGLTSLTKDPTKKCVHIKGRMTWLSTGEKERTNSNVIPIIVSNTLTERPDGVQYLVRTFRAALMVADGLMRNGTVETVWVMGGQPLYEEAIHSAQMLYLTQIDAHYECDRFFPAFEDAYDLTTDPGIDSGLQDDNGVTYKFEVYKKRQDL